MKRLLACLFLLVATNAWAQEKNITIARDFGSLSGTLLSPETQPRTVVLIIAGSGPTDRNGNNPAGLNTNAYLYLTQALEKAGIASLRYDKRGIGGSTYDNPSRMLEEELTMQTYIDDVRACIDYLAAQGYARIVLAGHSEGSTLALAAAQQNQAVSALISISGVGFPLDEVLRLQLAAQLAGYDMGLLMQAEGIIASLKRGERVETVPPVLAALFRPSVQPFLISSFRLDTRKLIRTLDIPILIVGGGNDVQITPGNAESLAKAQPRARKAIIAGMTHPLKLSEGATAAEQMSAYSDSTLPLPDEFTRAVTEFILGLE